MAGRIHDADDLFTSLNSTPTAPQQISSSENFINLDADDADDDEDCNKTTSTPKTPMVFDRFYESSSEEEFSSTSNCCSGDNFLVQTAGKRLDYMIRYLDKKLSTLEANHNELNRALPEFVASGGGRGIFKLPVRAAVHPDRPPSLELRPHPFRETQVGCSLSVLEGTGDGGQLWAGSECGVRVWDMTDMYAAGVGEGEEEEVPYYESTRTAQTLCLVVDDANKVVWSGHKDGKIMCWKMHRSLDACDVSFRECLSWQAHHGPVLSMVISSYGDLWSGSEGGAITVWPCEAITKALWLTLEERHMGGLIVERSCIDLKNQVTMNGVSCSVLAADVRYMVSDHCGTKVWSAGYLSFALWDAYTRELLKVFNTDGQTENLSVIQDLTAEEEARMKFASGPKSLFQRSRNAILGAADAVRRVAVKGSFGDDNRRTEALIIMADGVVWTGSTSGLLVQWDGNGNRLQELQYHCYAINCLCTFGLRMWVGYASGTLQVLDLDGNLLGEWVAHSSPIVRIAVGPGYIFTLANDGGIRGWSISSPGHLDSILRPEIAGKEFLYTRQENLKILAGTWNVAQGKAKYDSLISWLGSALVDVDIVAVGLQEMEMGAGFLAMSAARETMQVGLEGSSSGQWWLDMLGKTLNEGSSFQRVGSRQLAGLLIAVWVRNTIRSNFGDVDVAAVPCGFGRAIGNKGAVGLRMRAYSRILCFVNCHFAAHLEAVSRRNADFDHVYRTMSFCRSSNLVNSLGTHQSIDGLPELSKADMVVFLGDFNYRLDGISYDEARDFVSQRSFDWLKEKDQLGIEMKAGSVFQGMREAVITFPPTYKFERHQAGLAGYDSGEKKRIPAWCDRILYRDSRPTSSSTCNLNCPVVSSILQYEACMDVTDSDHKPVRCIFNVELARVDESIRRQEFGEIIRSNDKIRHILEEQYNVPEVILSTNTIILQDHDKSVLRISNRSGKDKALFRVICESQRPRGSFGFPRWLQVKPTVGIIEPNHIMEISVHLHHQPYAIFEEFEDSDPQSQSQNKEAVLIVEVRGSCTSKKKDHRVHVRRAPRKSTPTESQNHSRVQGNLLHRSDINWLSGSSDVFDHLHELYTP